MTNQVNKKIERVAVMYQPHISKVAALFAVVLTASVILYSVFLLEAVGHAASKTSAEKQLQTVGEHLGALEGQYLAMTQALTPQRATSLGFVAPMVAFSVYTHGDGGSLSYQSR